MVYFNQVQREIHDRGCEMPEEAYAYSLHGLSEIQKNEKLCYAIMFAQAFFLVAIHK